MATTENLQWIDPRDDVLDWLNVADWEAKGDGLQPVRVAKAWRDKWPPKTARRATSAAGIAVRFRTDAQKLVFRVTFREFPDETPPAVAAGAWERARPNFFSLYRDGKYVASMAGDTHFERQDVTIYDDRSVSGQSEVQVLLPFYYRNAEIILHNIGVNAGAQLSRAPEDRRPRIFFNGDSITQGHGVTSPRETYVWQVAEQLNCVGINFGFGGSGWADKVVAETIAARSDWDVLVNMLGTNSFVGSDAFGKPETAAQYTQKYDAFLGAIRQGHPQKPILCVAPILNRADLARGPNANGEGSELYRSGIARVVKQRQQTDKNLYFLDGLELVNDPLFLLVTDRVHPNDAGMHRIANGVAAALRPLLAGLK
jgi:lysophospholipase L1-like esterase